MKYYVLYPECLLDVINALHTVVTAQRESVS